MSILSVAVSQSLGAFELDASLDAPHRVTGLFGRSGSGKTSLLRSIAGLANPARGVIRVGADTLLDTDAGVDIPVHRRQIGTVFQEARLFPHLTVAQNIDFGARYTSNRPSATSRQKLVDVLGLGHLEPRAPGTLSGGEKSRVALARALMSAPRLLLLDEPLAALDWARKAEILPYLQALVAETATPMLYVSHDMDEIVRLADGLAIMREGRVVAQGAIEQVLSDPALVPLIGPKDAGAVLHGRLEAHSSDGLSHVALSSGAIWVPRIDALVGAQVRLRVRAQDVMLSTQRPQGLSAQTVLKMQIMQIRRGQGPGVAVALEAGSDRLLARITGRALDDLKLEEGQTIWAVLKATAPPTSAVTTR